MTFVPAFTNARLRFLLQFMTAAGAVIAPPAGTYECRFYKVEGGPVSFQFLTSDASLIVRATGDMGIEFDKSMAAVVGLEERRYLWHLVKIGAPDEWMASGDLIVGANGGIESRFRVFEAYNGALPKIVAPAFASHRPPSYTVSSVPSASLAGEGSLIFVSNETGGAVLAFSDGTAWRRVTDRQIVA